jgi:phosphate starvation-inducible PhoH-like protein
MEKAIQLQSQEEEKVLLGRFDRVIRSLRDLFGVRAISRGGLIKLSGSDDSVESAFTALSQILRDLRSNGSISEEEILDRLKARSTADGALVEAVSNGAPIVGSVRPRTAGQRRYVQLMNETDVVFAIGPAGTGKTYLAVAMALNRLRGGFVRKIILARPAVEAGERLGFLPGDYQAKVNPYLRPLYDALNDMLDFGQIKRYIDRDIIEVVPLAFMRGRTLDHAAIILDEGQNTTPSQMMMFLTRMGLGSKVVVTGDVTQIDLPKEQRSGLIDAERVLKDVEGVAFAYLERQDIVRHRVVQNIVDAYSARGGPPPGAAP